MLDDVPNSIKKYKVGAGQLAALVMSATKGSKDSWFTPEELDGLSCLVGFHVTGAHVHRTPRRRLYDHDRHGRTGRLTCALTMRWKPWTMEPDSLEVVRRDLPFGQE